MKRQDFPHLEDLMANFPSAETLLTKPAVDWLILNKLDGGKEIVLEVQPVTPRPNTLEKMKEAAEAFPPVPRDASEEDKQKHLQRREQLNKLSIFLPDDKTNTEYFLDYRSIDRIYYHEDKLLHWVKEYGKEGRFREAFDLLFKLKRRVPDWPGTEDQHDNLIHIEAFYNLEKGNAETAFAWLIELYERNPKYPDLSLDFDKVIDALVNESIQQEEYRRAPAII
ncbi:MAG: hypothetical protein R3C11_04110 [Planctomycetaceae bacterium]